MQRIVVINPKGGSGKTTLATNLASFYSQQGMVTTLMDLDPQGASVFWALNRPESAPHVQLVDAHNCPQNVTRSWAIQPPRNTEVLILDTPARPDLTNLSPLLREATAILMPTLLSEFDLHAITNNVQQLRRILPGRKNLALIINRSPQSTSAINRADELARTLELPIASHLRDSRTFLQAASEGKGVCEMTGSHYHHDRRSISRIAKWCTSTASALSEPPGKRLSPQSIALAGLV